MSGLTIYEWTCPDDDCERTVASSVDSLLRTESLRHQRGEHGEILDSQPLKRMEER